MAKKQPYEILEHGLKALGNEVSQHKQIDKALQQSEERYQTLYRNTPAMMHSIDRNGRLIEVSDYWLKIMGYQRNEVIQQHLTDFMTEESGDFVRRIMLPESFENGSVENIPCHFVKRNGMVMDTLLSAIAERDSEGKPIRSLGVVNDVTEQKQAEDALRMSERLYRLLADNVTDIIWTINANRLITYVSPSIKHLLGYDVEEITLQAIEEVLSPASYSLARKIFEEEMTKGKIQGKDSFRSIKVELELKHKNGSCIFTDTRMTFLQDSEGETMVLLGITRDIKERVQVERELQLAHYELEQRVEKRTAQLSESNDRLKKEIIEHIRTERRLRRSEARLAEAQRIAHLGNWDWDIVNNDLCWSDEVYRIFGIKPQEFEATYEAFLDHVHP
ncbi:MAG: PAS domain S-box protein, partial [Thermodesulfobacteriota bacterium]|nr:PAS domain S-box protein [Thermodesulfobacteriota bacterium]